MSDTIQDRIRRMEEADAEHWTAEDQAVADDIDEELPIHPMDAEMLRRTLKSANRLLQKLRVIHGYKSKT